jgi:membrane-associated phospholipid phosphatase
MSTKVKAKYFFLLSIVNLALYFVVQGYVTKHELDLMTELDSAIPFMPENIWIYHSIFPVIGATMILLVKKRKVFFTTFWSCVLAMAVLNLMYVLFPSFYPRETFEINTISELLLDMTRNIDGANNTFPSGHVTFAWILFWGVFYSKIANTFEGLRSLYMLWAIGISLSTLVLKQHYVVDVVSGFGLAMTIFFLVKSAIESYGLYENDEKVHSRI